MHEYSGISALTAFAAKKLLALLNQHGEDIGSISAEYVHLVKPAKALKETDRTTLDSLLSYGEVFSKSRTSNQLIVGPRLGTITPWSSKATDIAKNTGLDRVTRIERFTRFYSDKPMSQSQARLLFDPMQMQLYADLDAAKEIFKKEQPRQLKFIELGNSPERALSLANVDMGLALSDDEIKYLARAYKLLARDPSDVELMMFSVVNSEHCRHKIFNADWVVEGEKSNQSLFSMIRNTHANHSEGILSAYSDNAAVLSGKTGERFFVEPRDQSYEYSSEPIHSVIKVETHNHPTAVAPNPGAATGTGGEIRDEAATGRGAKSKMGMAGFNVSNLYLPNRPVDWETTQSKPSRIASALDIMIEAPIGAASYGNEFGRPNLAGYFRSLEIIQDSETRGYHKPIMIAGGLGNVRDVHVQKGQLEAGSKLVVLGGPSMLIGLGGGAASSMQSGQSSEDLDFASVQRANAEMERRAQEVIDRCWEMGENNPIIAIHDVGAGGLSNAMPELVKDSGLGGEFNLRDIPSAEAGLSPLEIWCNESQERYVLGLSEEDLPKFEKICRRERCPFAVIGEAIDEDRLTLKDSRDSSTPIDIPMSVLFGNPPKMTRTANRQKTNLDKFDASGLGIEEALSRVLRMPAVGSKKFLITIGDRNVGGLTMRDQMIGPWQAPVADVAVTAAGFNTKFGEAMAVGERPNLALINAPASARIAIAEAVTNIMASQVNELSDIKLSANWMAAADQPEEESRLYETVKAVGLEFCPELNLTIPVGKDSLSMRTVWEENGKSKSVTAPLSVVFTAFSPVEDVGKTLTPQLHSSSGTSIILVDLGKGKNRLGGSTLAQSYSSLGTQTPDVATKDLKNLFEITTELKRSSAIMAYHDRSDGGAVVSLLEMAFASGEGLDVVLEDKKSAIETLFNEEIGILIQVKDSKTQAVIDAYKKAKLSAFVIAKPNNTEEFRVSSAGEGLFGRDIINLEQTWADTSYHIQRLRDNPDSADSEKKLIKDKTISRLKPQADEFKRQRSSLKTRPKLAILREQGVNGHVEMAAAFHEAGFSCVDVHMSDLISQRLKLANFSGLVACGGFSYGDVLGAGEGWAKTILHRADLRQQFSEFFADKNKFGLGVCNGCQMMAQLKEIIPGAKAWPNFKANQSAQFEARLVSVKVNRSPSILLKGMEQMVLPVPVAHGEGRAVFDETADQTSATNNGLIALNYVDGNHELSEVYPINPNGSADGITGLTNKDGRFTIMMPHPERAWQTRQLSWAPENWTKYSPWIKMFDNAREWIG